MSVIAPRLLASATVKASPALAAETDVCEIAGIATRSDQDAVILHGSVDITAGTAGTAVTLKIRQGAGVGGTVVATYGPVTVTAADRYSIPIDGVDVPGQVAGESYTLTATVTAASAASTVHACALTALY